MGDIVIRAVVIGFFVVIGAIILVAMFSKNNKGQWDERSRLRGQLRAEHWHLRDTVDNLKDFLLGPAAEVEHWPVAQSVGGIMGITADSGRYRWRSAATIRPGLGAHLMMSVELPQLPDGAEGDMPEVLMQRDADGFWTVSWGSESATVSPDGVTHDPLPLLVTTPVLEYVVKWGRIESVHLRANRVTVELNSERSLEDTITVLKETEGEIGGLINTLPREAWTADGADARN